MGGFTRTATERKEDSDQALNPVPTPEGATCTKAGSLSGGEQQMLAIGRALDVASEDCSFSTSLLWAWHLSWCSRPST